MSITNSNHNPNDSKSSLVKALKLYLVSDRSWLKGPSENAENEFCEVIEQAIAGGVTILQYREKDLSYSENLKLASKLQKVARMSQVPFIVNDDVDLALEIEADGVHVGQTDRGYAETRLMMGPQKILGVSVSTVEEALSAEAAGADYLGVGAMFATSTKQDAKSVQLSELQAICKAVSIPVVAIGGINESNAHVLMSSGIDGIAVISAVLSKECPKEAATELISVLQTLNRQF